MYANETCSYLLIQLALPMCIMLFLFSLFLCYNNCCQYLFSPFILRNFHQPFLPKKPLDLVLQETFKNIMESKQSTVLQHYCRRILWYSIADGTLLIDISHHNLFKIKKKLFRQFVWLKIVSYWYCQFFGPTKEFSLEESCHNVNCNYNL